MKRHILNLFHRLGLELKKYDPDLPEIWSNDTRFLSLLKEVEGHTLVSRERLFMLYQLAERVKEKPGAMAEIGVYRGGTARVLARTCPEKRLLLFDTFSGMPESDPTFDWHHQGDFSDISLQAVRDYLKDCLNVEYHPGQFPQSAGTLAAQDYALVHIDVDLYRSVKECLDYFFAMMVPGGIMVCDDYQWKACPGVKKAIDEFLSTKKEKVFITTRYQAMIVKN